MSKPKRGRPSKGKAARTVQVTFKVSRQEREAWAAAAGPLPLAEWIRQQCNQAAR